MRSDKPVRTIADIAQLAGVSKSTVSRALSDSSLISQETKDRIRAIAQEHQFKIHQPARRLSMKQSYTVAFVTHAYKKAKCSVMDPFSLEIVGNIANAVSSFNYDLLMVHVEPQDTEWPRRYLDSGRVDGFILISSTQKTRNVRILQEAQAPFIVWGGGPAAHNKYPSVTSDNTMGGRLATQHLIEQGRQRIAFLGGPPGEIEVKFRYQGYQEALTAAGRSVDPTLVDYGDFSSKSGADAMERLLKAAPDLDAVFVNSDVMAIAAMGVLQAHGCRVPQDIAVVGFDDISLAEHCGPPLTTVRQDLQAAGRLLVQNLIQYLETGMITNVSVPVELVVRQSSGA